ncbi:3-oxo-5a-steroid 4- dehydrogenase [Tulasnella sp. 403]|nr:3-oxo-5a-steroid 4- dehydrogenase [Tulasnella sp. 403]
MPTIRVEAKDKKTTSLAKALPISLKLQDADTVYSLKQQLQSHFPRLPISQQRLTLSSGKALENETKVGELGDVTVYVKDLGLQIGWRTVFYVEYLGPLLINPIFYFFPKIYAFYDNKPFEHSQLQRLVFGIVTLHYLKREYETAFVHRFSLDTMPILNIFRNSLYYWFPSGVFLCGAMYGPWYSQAALQGTLRDDPLWLYGLASIWVYAEVSNFITHLTLRDLRPSGTRQRGIPRGYGFDMVTCANYTFEIVGWLAVSLMTMNVAVFIFTLIGINMMTSWAIKKHLRYKKEFGTEYPRRWVIFPFVY